MEDESEEEILEEQMTSNKQRHFLYTAEETSKSTQKMDSNHNQSRGTDSLREDEKKLSGPNDDSDDTSFTDDKTVATANIQNIKLKSPTNSPRDPTDEFIDKSTSPTDDEKSTYSSGTGLSLSSTWSSASTATSTRRRHRGAVKSRKILSETNKTTGWYESIQAVAEKNKRVWDANRGWVDYVEPDMQLNSTSSQNNIGSISIKPLSPKKREQEEDEDSHDDVQRQPIKASPPSPKTKRNEGNPPRTPPKRSSNDQSNISQDDESLAQPSVGSTITDSSDQPRSPAQFLPAKELSVANDTNIHVKIDSSTDKKDEQFHQVSEPVSPIRKTTSRSIEQSDTHDTEKTDTSELNIALTYSEDSDDETDTNGGSVEVKSSGSETDKQDENAYQILDETDYNDDDDDFVIPVEKEKRNSDPSIQSDEETSSLLDDSEERNMLYNWLESGENEVDPFGVIPEQDDVPETDLKEEKSKLENDFVNNIQKPPTHPFTKPEMSKISDDDDKSAFETSKGILVEGLSQSTSNESDSSQRSAYDNNGFKIIKDPKLVDWGKQHSSTSLGDAELGMVATFSESDGETEVKSDQQSSDDEETSKMSADDQKSVKTHNTGVSSANSVSSRARKWMEMMETKKARLDSSQEINESFSADSGSRSRKLDVLVETSINADVMNSNNPQNTSKETVVPVTEANQKVSKTEKKESEALQIKNVKSNEEVPKDNMMTFVSADDDSVFKFERSRQIADDDTIFSNLDEKKNTEANKVPRVNVKKTFTRDDGYGQSGNLYIQNTNKKDLLSINSDSFDETTLHSRSTVDKYGTGFEINSSFHRDDYSMASGKRSTFLSRMVNFASVCEPMMPNALSCNPRKSEQGAQEVPLAHLAFLQQRSVPNAEPLSRESKSLDSRYFNEEEYPDRNVSPGNAAENQQPQSKPPLPTERRSDTGLSSSYLAAMAKFNQGGNKNQARSNASSDTSSRNENWKGFLERRSQSGVSNNSPRRSSSGRSASAEQHAAKKVEKLMRSLSQSENSGKEEVQTMLDSMSPKSKSRFRSPSAIESSSSRASNKKMAAAEARVEAMMAAMSKSDLEEAEI